MSDMMVIVSKAVFEKARTSEGEKLSVGDLYEVDTYFSKNKSIAKKLTGDLFLVTVRGDQLWLVAHLESPSQTEDGWTASKNGKMIKDVSNVAAKIKFDTGKGINLEKMAMSLQTPRVLTEEDVALLNSSSVAPIEEEDELTRVIVKVAAYVLNRTEEEVRDDAGKYAAIHWDDVIYEYVFEGIDWSTFVTAEDKPKPYRNFIDDGDGLFGRADFDIARSRVVSCLKLLQTTDKSLNDLIQEQGGLYAMQVAQAIQAGRLQPDAIRYTDFNFHGRIVAKSTSLKDAFRALFLLNDFPRERLKQGEYSEVHEQHRSMIESIKNLELRDHVANFFQSAQSARCTGAALDKPSEKSDIVASWWIGEGQGDCWIEKIDDDDVCDIPEFDGYSPLFHRPREIKETALKSESGTSEELFASVDLSEVLKEHAEYSIRKKVESQNAEAFLAGIAIAAPEGECPLQVVIRYELARNEYQQKVRPVWRVADAIAKHAQPAHAFFVHWVRADCLHLLGCIEEAKEAFDLALSCKGDFVNFKKSPVKTAHFYVQFGELFLAMGLLSEAKEMANRALSEWKGKAPFYNASALRGFARLLEGDESGLDDLEICFVDRIDPKPPESVASLPVYVQRATERSISIPRFD